MAERDSASDFANALAAMAKAGADMKSLNREFAETTSFAKDLASILGQVAKTSTDLPRGVKTTKDLMSAMLKDEKLFAKIQKQSFSLQHDELKKYWEKKITTIRKISGLGWDQIKQLKQYKYLQELMKVLDSKKTKELKSQFDDLKNQAGSLDKQKDKIIDIKGMWEKVGSAIRHPSQIFAGFTSMLSKGLSKGIQLLGGLTTAFGALSAVLGAGILGALMLVISSFTQMWGFLDKKVMPATAAFNKQIGNMGQSTKALSGEMISTGVQFEMLGKSFEEGAGNVRDFAEGMMLVGRSEEELHDIVQTGLKLTQVVGLSAEQSGKLALFWEKSEGSLSGLNESMDEASVVAHKYQVPVNQIRRDLGDDLNLLSRFGTRNRQVMLESAAKARTYGLSIKEINASFGEQMDTFDKTSDVAAKLSSVFGTHINSYELMLETDPTKRMELMREELVKQKKTWDKLNVFEKNVISSTLGVSKQEAALVLSSDNARKKIQAQAKEQERLHKINMDWNKGLGNVKETLLALQPKLDLILRSVSDFVSQLFDFGSAGSATETTAEKVGRALDIINEKIKTATESVETFRDIFAQIKAVLPFGGGGAFYDFMEEARNKQMGLSGLSEMGIPDVSEKTIPAQDALITKTGEVVRFNQNDNILSTRSPISRTTQGATANAGRGAQTEQNIVITPANVYIDGKELAKIIFNQTRR